MKKNQRYSIEGMQCVDCENAIESAVLGLPGVLNASSDFATETLELNFDEDIVQIDSIRNAIKTAGYTSHSYIKKKPPELVKSWFYLILGLVALVLLYNLKNLFAIDFSLAEISENANYGLLFLIGVLTSFHCIGMCGGFVLSYSLGGSKSNKSPHLKHFLYALGKMVSYSGTGAILGLVGSIFTITAIMKSLVSGFAGLFLLMYGLSMMDAFAGLRRFHIRLLKFITLGLFKQQQRTTNPLYIGFLNGFMIACGPLQAMYILAAGTGSALEGSKLLAAFGLGTLPLMLSLGYMANLVTANVARRFIKFSGIIIIVLGLIMLNRGLVLSGTGYHFNSLANQARLVIKNNLSEWGVNDVKNNVYLQNGYQLIYMEVEADRYIPDSFEVKKNVPVKWIINLKSLSNCSNQIDIPKLNKSITLKPGLQLVNFTPTEDAGISWSCHMGMIPGNFNIVE